jgi:hypothetical protein
VKQQHHTNGNVGKERCDQSLLGVEWPHVFPLEVRKHELLTIGVLQKASGLDDIVLNRHLRLPEASLADRGSTLRDPPLLS